MSYEAKKTENCGPKRGNAACWGYKREAKKESNRIRHENAKREIRRAAAESAPIETRSFGSQSAVDRWSVSSHKMSRTTLQRSRKLTHLCSPEVTHPQNRIENVL